MDVCQYIGGRERVRERIFSFTAAARVIEMRSVENSRGNREPLINSALALAARASGPYELLKTK